MSIVSRITKTKAWQFFMDVVAKIHWPRTQAVLNGGVYYRLAEPEHDRIRELLRYNYFIIATRRSSHLSTHLISLGDLILRGKMSHYTHVLMNVEGDLDGHVGFKLIEATGNTSVGYVSFMNVFNCDSVALMVPKGVSPTEWTLILDRVKDSLGVPYDTLFDITSSERMSCVELIYWGLKELPDFETRFPRLLSLIEQGQNLTPQMFYDSGEFDIVYEARK